MKTCTVEKCGKKHWAKGLCLNHYMKVWNREHPRVTREIAERGVAVIFGNGSEMISKGQNG